MLQDWLRYIHKTQKNWSLVEKNFKWVCSMTTDLVVEFIEKSQEIPPTPEPPKNDLKNKPKFTKISRPVDNLKFAQIRKNLINNANKSPSMANPVNDETFNSNDFPSKIPISATLALKQLLLVLIECSAHQQESVARVGVSCLKHIIFSIGGMFNEDQWLVVCSAIHRATSLNIAPLRQLSFAFDENSNSFYGDCATVKVAARRDCTLEEINR